MKFAQAIDVQEARTENNMKAFKSSASKNVDLFSSIGASRGQNIVPAFVGALTENREYALRIAQWARDVRGGSGERKLFRDILNYLVTSEANKPESYGTILRLLSKAPELGRWDDMWSVYGLNDGIDTFIVNTVVTELEKGNGLLAKWLPRQAEVINGKDFTKALRERMRLSPKDYRKMVVGYTNVVEQYMCAKNWNEINFSHVPSVAHARYKKAFFKNAEEYYKAYVAALVKNDGSAKINAGAVYPYDVIKGFFKRVYGGGYGGARPYNETEKAVINEQWKALPDYLGDNSVLALVDVSGSMDMQPIPNSVVTPMDVAVSLGLYVADKLKGDFKDCFLTFNTTPELLKLRGDVTEKLAQMANSKWGGSTNLHAAFDLILKTALKGNVSQEDMPKTLVILSDMNFNACVKFDDSAFEMITRKYSEAGYEMPQIVFWNLRASGHQPVTFDQKGTALVSGFSPAILRSILSAKSFTPEDVMLETIMKERYNLD